jgi:hypothetical protein
MSLMRAFTMRRNKPDMSINVPIGRAASQRAGKPILRTQISSPIALISTSNMLSFEAPDIQGTTPVYHHEGSSASSMNSSSGEESDASTANSIHSNDTMTDMSSVGDSSPTSPEPNHLSCYFKPAVETSTNSSPIHSPHLSVISIFDAPIIPQRALSHSKEAHETLSRQRSLRAASPALTTRSSTEIISSGRNTLAEAPRESPFGKELAQLDEVAEEFGNTVRNVEADADSKFMESHNLAAFDASEYLTEIHDLLNELYGDEQPEIGTWF